MAHDWDKNYFELFGLPVGFTVDGAALAERYRSLQRQVHPDKFAAASSQERRLSMQLTTLVNEAYQTLRDPVRRGRYLLGLKGLATHDETDTRMDPAFLMEQMELRESLDEARGREDAHKRLAELANDIEQRFARKQDEFARCWEGQLAEADRARQVVREMQFLDKLLNEIREREGELA
jgi:molecular chaperone HscB